MVNNLKENNIKEIKESVMIMDYVPSDREYQLKDRNYKKRIKWKFWS